jgi:hypothetical protein
MSVATAQCCEPNAPCVPYTPSGECNTWPADSLAMNVQMESSGGVVYVTGPVAQYPLGTSITWRMVDGTSTTKGVSIKAANYDGSPVTFCFNPTRQLVSSIQMANFTGDAISFPSTLQSGQNCFSTSSVIVNNLAAIAPTLPRPVMAGLGASLALVGCVFAVRSRVRKPYGIRQIGAQFRLWRNCLIKRDR